MRVLILAAGRSTRFLQGAESDASETTKLLAKFLGLPLIQHVVDRALQLVSQQRAEDVTIAVSDDSVGLSLEDALRQQSSNVAAFQNGSIRTVRVSSPIRGSAATAYEALRAANLTSGSVLLLVGDAPLISIDDLTRIIDTHAAKPPKTAGVLLGVKRHDPEQYGSLTASKHKSGKTALRRIVPSSRRSKATKSNVLVNAGAMTVDVAAFTRLLGKLVREKRRSSGAKLGSVSLDDMAALLHREGRPMLLLQTDDYLGTTGIDTQNGLTNLESMVINVQMSSARQEMHREVARSSAQRNLEKALREGLGLAPQQVIDQPGIEGYVLSKSHGAELGGDFFVAGMTQGRHCYLIGDGRGHGINGALNMLPVLTGFHMCYQESLSTKHVLHRLSALCSGSVFTVQASALYFILDDPDAAGARRIYAASAGHPPMIVLQDDGKDDDFPDDAANQGLLGSALDISIHEACRDLHIGDTLVAFTDGVSEAQPTDTDGKLFGRAGIVRAALAALERSPQDIAEGILAAAESHSGGELADDATVMVLKIREKRSAVRTI